jgi:hypothetical protein
VPWGRFSQDPRRAEAAGLRASDQDRAVVLDVLAEGYADGRLDRHEYDERAEHASSSKTLGELPALIDDLVPAAGGWPSEDIALATQDQLHGQAVRRWQGHLRQAVSGFLIPSLICWVIWVFSGLGEAGGFHANFPWPIFVSLGTGTNLLRVVLNRQELVEQEQRRLERKQRKAIESRVREA